jgi:signal transduction histidine kinase
VRRSLKTKLILSYLAVALITVVVASALIRANSGESLMSLVADQQIALLEKSVQDYYTANGSLAGFFDYYLRANVPFPPASTPQPGLVDVPPQARQVRGVLGLVDTNYTALIPTLGYDVGQTVPAGQVQQAVPVKVKDQTVAWILPDARLQFQLNAEEQLFLQRTNLAIGIASLAGLLAAVGMGFLLAGGLLRPIRHLTKASQGLSSGALGQQVPVTSQDELGQLTETFNKMSADLVDADQQRKRVTADITHDLSTPLQIISGYMEMLEENGGSLTPQQIEIIETEIDHLRRLVKDLSTLTQVEAGGLEMRLQPIRPAALMERVYRGFGPIAARQGVELALDVPDSAPAILVDEGRVLQVLRNLVENALRYTPEGGRIRLGVRVGERVELLVSDSGSGIDPADLPYVFNRFYRADKAREGNSGNMGLGLAICKALVNAQGGSISAWSAGKGQGTTMTIAFDPAPQQAD